MKTKLCLLTILSTLLIQTATSQIYDQDQGCLVSSLGEPCYPNPIHTAVPFISLVSDARSGGMGLTGIASANDANGLQHNASTLVFNENSFGMSASLMPWFRNFGFKDIFLANFSGYYQLSPKQAIGFGAKYFSLGDIQFTSSGTSGSFTPHEIEMAVAYSRKFNPNFSMALTGKYIYSGLTPKIQSPGSLNFQPGEGIAADFGMSYKIPLSLGSKTSDLSVGLVISNFGTKISYIIKGEKDYLPTNLGAGIAWNKKLNPINQITITADLNKLLVPTPIPIQDSINFDLNKNGYPDYKELNVIQAAMISFNDAPGGIAEELSEIRLSMGAEYRYKEKFAFRMGYFYGSPRKGDRQYFTYGLGLKIKALSMNISHVINLSDRKGPLDSSLRMSLLVNLGNSDQLMNSN